MDSTFEKCGMSKAEAVFASEVTSAILNLGETMSVAQPLWILLNTSRLALAGRPPMGCSLDLETVASRRHKLFANMVGIPEIGE